MRPHRPPLAGGFDRRRRITGRPWPPVRGLPAQSAPAGDNAPVRIGISGKGGVGKTTIAAVTARHLARRGRRVIAIDCDSDPNLAMSAGLPDAEAAYMRPLLDQSNGGRRLPDGLSPAELLAEYGRSGPDGITLLLGARVERAGAG